MECVGYLSMPISFFSYAGNIAFSTGTVAFAHHYLAVEQRKATPQADSAEVIEVEEVLCSFERESSLFQ